MLCRECQKENKTSRVYPEGMGYTTAVWYPPFYDETGRFHHHDGNNSVHGYRCSNGHTWTETTTGYCWCGWPTEPEKEDPKIS